MPYNFTDATLLGYEIANNFLGQGLFSLNSKKNISIKGIFDNRFSNPTAAGVKESIIDIKNLETGSFDVYEDVFVNGYNLGKGRIISVSFPNPNPIRVGEYNYEIEIIQTGDFKNAPSDSIYGSISSLTGVILNFNENFSFNYQENSDLNYNHQIDIQYYDDNSDTVSRAKSLANTLFNDNLKLGLFGPFSGIYGNLRNRKNYFTETYNLIDKSCSFSKNVTINLNNNLNYSNTVTHSMSFDANGKITVTEEGLIVGLDNTSNFTAENYFSDAISSSYSRCNAFLNSYASLYNLNSYGILYNQPFNLGKTFDQYTNTVRYNISYTNDLAFEGNVINNYTITINQDSNNLQSYTENGEIIQVGQLGSITGLNIIKQKFQEANTRALANYPDFKLRSSTLNLGTINNNYDNSFSYILEKTNDATILENNPLFTSLNVQVSDQPSFQNYKEYTIANKLPKNILFLYGNNTEIGDRSVSINGTLKRPNGNIWDSPISLPLLDLKNLAVSQTFDLISSEAFINSVSYNYDSQNNFSFNLNIKYLKPTGI
jgi:hypothetical protein